MSSVYHRDMRKQPVFRDVTDESQNKSEPQKMQENV